MRLPHVKRQTILVLVAVVAAELVGTSLSRAAMAGEARPNIVFILTDDQRFDAMGCAGNALIRTPNIDELATHGVRFDRAFVTLSICSPSRAACLTGRYGSCNGVTTLGRPLREGERTFAQLLKTVGYQTGVVGKWHLGTTPEACGFDFVRTFRANGAYYGRTVVENGKKNKVPGYIEDYIARQAISFIQSAARRPEPFVLWICTQVPHMNHEMDWNARPDTLASYKVSEMPVPETWQDKLAGKPPYLKNARSRTQALHYGYDDKRAIQRHFQRYYAAVTEMDAALGKVFHAIDRLGLTKNTWFLLMGDNGWFMGEHGFTSKVLPYEESIRVPMILAGPGLKPRVDHHLVLNIDLAATVLDLAGVPIPSNMQGRSLLPLAGDRGVQWRESFLYEAPTPALGSWPLSAVRSDRWKYIETYDLEHPSRLVFQELYDLRSDPREMHNVADDDAQAETVRELSRKLEQHKNQLRQAR